MIDTIVNGMRAVLARAESWGHVRMLFTSSGAVYGRQPPDITHLAEDDRGGPDPLAPANAYHEGKRLAEMLGALSTAAGSLDVVNGRLFAFLGPHLPLDAHFAAGNFLRDALAGGPIVVGGDGTPFRSYQYPSDLVVWLLALLVRGTPGHAYNVGSDEAVDIRALAERIAVAAERVLRVTRQRRGARRPGRLATARALRAEYRARLPGAGAAQPSLVGRCHQPYAGVLRRHDLGTRCAFEDAAPPMPALPRGDGRVLHTQLFASLDELGAEDVVDVVACDRCGFVFSDIPTSQVELDRTYEEHSKYADTALFGKDADDTDDQLEMPPEPPWDLERLQRDCRVARRAARCRCPPARRGMRDRLAPRLPPRPGLGEPRGPRPVSDRHGHGAASAWRGSRGRARSLHRRPAFGPFDVVVLSHVLEHLADVRAAVASMRDLTVPGGAVYIEVPDAEHYADHLVAPFQDFNTEHINHFSLGLLERFMATQGFETITSGHKIVMCSAVDTYPTIYGLWRRVEVADGAEPDLANDDALDAGVSRYIEASSACCTRIDAHLTAEIGAADSVIVWGAGQLAMKFLRATVLARVPWSPSSTARRRSTACTSAACPSCAPEKIVGSTEPIIVTSVHLDTSIVRTCNDLGLTNRRDQDPATVVGENESGARLKTGVFEQERRPGAADGRYDMTGVEELVDGPPFVPRVERLIEIEEITGLQLVRQPVQRECRRTVEVEVEEDTDRTVDPQMELRQRVVDESDVPRHTAGHR